MIKEIFRIYRMIFGWILSLPFIYIGAYFVCFMLTLPVTHIAVFNILYVAQILTHGEALFFGLVSFALITLPIIIALDKIDFGMKSLNFFGKVIRVIKGKEGDE